MAARRIFCGDGGGNQTPADIPGKPGNFSNEFIFDGRSGLH
jgi:hypothetical protein